MEARAYVRTCVRLSSLLTIEFSSRSHPIPDIYGETRTGDDVEENGRVCVRAFVRT